MNKGTLSSSAELSNLMRKVRDQIQREVHIKAEHLASILVKSFTEFKMLAPDQGRGITLNTTTLRQCTILFSEDIIRLQMHHPIDVASKYKYAGFIFKWINKLRPIKILDNYSGDSSEKHTYINAFFSVHCALAFLECPLPAISQMREIVYMATFQDINPEQWALLFYYMEKANLKK